MKFERYISVIIPNHNGESTIEKCLEATYSSRYRNFEVIVVDDYSKDGSVEIIKKFPCKLIRLDKHSGASKARNVGAQNSSGEIFFFVDADCLLQEDTLALVNKTIEEYNNDNIIPLTPPFSKGGSGGITIIGGTYTKIPYDDNFFSTFQSIFINYSETKHKEAPDYIATHAMIIDNKIFRNNGGFQEDLFLPILEDVEFSHRLMRSGFRLVINPEILVQHIFNFSLFRSLSNAVRKSMHWTAYSIKNRDLLIDSGTASIELKFNVLSYFLSLLVVLFSFFFKVSIFLMAIPLIFGINIYVNRKLFKSFYEAKGLSFTVAAIPYYTIIYPLGVGAGAFAGILTYFWMLKIRKGKG